MLALREIERKLILTDVVEELRNTTQNYENDGLEHFIGFEHIESNNIKVKTFGNLSDGVSFNKTFRKGDVLFGKIRAYLRKVAVAPFDGVCSGDILVLRSKDENLFSQKLLPYLLTTERFVKIAVDSSIGTTMPRTKWQHLSKFEFHLPTIEEQEKLANLFQSIDASIEQADEQEKNLLKLKNQLLRELFGGKRQFGNYLNEDDFETVKFEQLALHISERVEPQATDYEIYVGLEHLDPDNLKIERKGKPADVIGIKLKIYEGDIIFGKRRAYQRKVAVADFEGIVSAHSMVLRANEKMIEKDLLPFLMQSDIFMHRAVQISEGSLSPTIKWKVLANQEFVIPKRAKQKQIAATFIHFDQVSAEIRQQKQTLKNLKFKLLNEILG